MTPPSIRPPRGSPPTVWPRPRGAAVAHVVISCCSFVESEMVMLLTFTQSGSPPLTASAIAFDLTAHACALDEYAQSLSVSNEADVCADAQ